MNPFSLKNKNILVSGASSGIGAQCAVLCGQMGANVVLIARNEERLLNTKNQLNAEGNHLSYSIDITEFEKHENIISDIVIKLGKSMGLFTQKELKLSFLKLLQKQNISKRYLM